MKKISILLVSLVLAIVATVFSIILKDRIPYNIRNIMDITGYAQVKTRDIKNYTQEIIRLYRKGYRTLEIPISSEIAEIDLKFQALPQEASQDCNNISNLTRFQQIMDTAQPITLKQLANGDYGHADLSYHSQVHGKFKTSKGWYKIYLATTNGILTTPNGTKGVFSFDSCAAYCRNPEVIKFISPVKNSQTCWDSYGTMYSICKFCDSSAR